MYSRLTAVYFKVNSLQSKVTAPQSTVTAGHSNVPSVGSFKGHAAGDFKVTPRTFEGHTAAVRYSKLARGRQLFRLPVAQSTEQRHRRTTELHRSTTVSAVV